MPGASGSATRRRRSGADGGKLAASHYRRRCTDGDALTVKHAVGRRNPRPARAPGECREPARRMIPRRPGRRELPVRLKEIHNAHWPGIAPRIRLASPRVLLEISSRPAGNHRALGFNFPIPWPGCPVGPRSPGRSATASSSRWTNRRPGGCPYPWGRGPGDRRARPPPTVNPN
jgi:hypothetical protein